jgi:hypothetical protein
VRVSNQILAVSTRNRTACFGIRKGCEDIAPSNVTLTVWRAGCWPKKETICIQDIQSSSACGTCYTPTVRYETIDHWPIRVQYTGRDIDAQGRTCFILDRLLFEQGAGRYDADLTACGKTVRVHLSVQDSIEVGSMVNMPTTGCRVDCEVQGVRNV